MEPVQRSLGDELQSADTAASRVSRMFRSSGGATVGSDEQDQASFQNFPQSTPPARQSTTIAPTFTKPTIMGTLPQDFKIDKLKGQDDFENWQREMFTFFRLHSFDRVVTGEDLLEDCRTPEQRDCYRTRVTKAMAKIVFSVQRQVMKKYDRLVEKEDIVGLWKALRADYAQRRPTNPVTLLGELFTRKLKADEPVARYIEDIERIQHELKRTHSDLGDVWIVRILLTNVIDVFPDISRDHTPSSAQGDKLPALPEVKNMLLARDNIDTSNGRRPQVPRTTPGYRNQGNQGQGASTTLALQGQGRDNRNRNNQGSRDHPYDRRSSSNNSGRQDNRPRCNKCKKKGHFARDCWSGRDAGDRHGDGNGRTVEQTPPRDPRSLTGSVVCSVQEGTNNKTIVWCLDSGAQVNIGQDLSVFEKIEETTTHTLYMANGSSEVVTLKGTVVMMIKNEKTGKMEERLLDDVYYSPNASINLISMDFLQRGLFRMSFSMDQKMCFATKGKIKLKFAKEQGLYKLRAKQKKMVHFSVTAAATDGGASDEESTLWHQRFAHTATKTLLQMQKQGAVVGLKVKKRLSDYDCVPCILAKSKRMNYAANPVRATMPLLKLSVDLAPMDETAVCGSNHVMLVGCEATLTKWGYLLKDKSEATKFLIDLIKLLNNQFKDKGYSVKILHADRAGEFLSIELASFCDGLGIEQQFTNAYSPEENSLIERANGTVATKARALIQMTGLPEMMRGWAYLHVIETVNVTGTSALQGKTPYELLHGVVPDVGHLRTWGCLGYAIIHPQSRQRKEKLKPRVVPAILVGYSPDSKGYILLQVPTCKLLRHRAGNVKWQERYTLSNSDATKMLLNGYRYGDHQISDEPEVVRMKTTVDAMAVPQPLPPLAPVSSSTVAPEKAQDPVGVSKSVDGTVEKPVDDHDKRPRKPETVTSGRSTSARKPSRKVRENVEAEVDKILSTYAVLNKLTATVPADPSQLPLAKDIPIPRNHKEAMTSPFPAYLTAAEGEELSSRQTHGTWIEIKRATVPRSHRAITCRWVYVPKADSRGHVARFKARLVIHGFRQRHGVDYYETYSPVVRYDSIRAILYYAVRRGWEIQQYDVKTEFLHSDLDEEVYIIIR